MPLKYEVITTKLGSCVSLTSALAPAKQVSMASFTQLCKVIEIQCQTHASLHRIPIKICSLANFNPGIDSVLFDASAIMIKRKFTLSRYIHLNLCGDFGTSDHAEVTSLRYPHTSKDFHAVCLPFSYTSVFSVMYFLARIKIYTDEYKKI